MIETAVLTQHVARAARPIDNTARVMRFLETSPHLIDDNLKAYDLLINRFNRLVEDNSPYLILFPAVLQFKRTLVSHGIAQLPTIEEMKTKDEWTYHFGRGVRNAVRLMQHGQDQRTGLATYASSDRIDAASRTDVDESALVAGSMGHFIEQTMFVWLKKRINYRGAKDEIIHPLENMTLLMELESKHSPLFDEFLKLGWIKTDRMEKLKPQFEQLNEMLEARKKGTIYVRASFYDKLRRVASQEDLTENELKDSIGFVQVHPLDFFISGNALFCVVRQEIWKREKNGGCYTDFPMPLLEVVAITHPDKPLEFQGDLFNNGVHANNKKGLFYFYYGDSNDMPTVRLFRSPSWQFHDYDDKELAKMGTNAKEVEQHMSKVIKENPQRQFLIST